MGGRKLSPMAGAAGVQRHMQQGADDLDLELVASLLRKTQLQLSYKGTGREWGEATSRGNPVPSSASCSSKRQDCLPGNFHSVGHVSLETPI